MSETAPETEAALRFNREPGKTISLILGAGGTTLGLGAFSTLFSFSLNELLYSFIKHVDLTQLQVFTYGLCQLALVLFLLWQGLPQMLANGRKTFWIAASIAAGILLAAWLSTHAWQVWSPHAFPKLPDKITPDVTFMGCSAAHAAIWVLHAALISALAEAMLFQGYMFDALRSLPTWLTACSVVFFYCMLGGYSFGYDGMWLDLKLGSALVALRLAGGSFVYPAIASAIYRGIDEAALQWLTLP